jgi:hypothetical protein
VGPWHVRAVALPYGEEPVDLWVADGRIAAEPVPGAQELPGGWVSPGLVDARVRLTFQAHHRFDLPDGADLVEEHRRSPQPASTSGAPADLVTYGADPRGDLGELSRPAAILHGGLRLA